MKEKKLKKQIKKFVSEFLALALAMGMWQTPVFAGTGAGTGIATPGETTAGEATPGKATPGETTPGEETPGETTPGEETPGEVSPGETTPSEVATDYDIQLVYNEDVIESAQVVDYAYLGARSTTDAVTAGHRFLQFTYTGDITSLRLGFEGTGKTLWITENDEGTFKTPAGTMLEQTTADEPTTVVFDLKKSGIADVSKCDWIHWHYTGNGVTITDARLMVGPAPTIQIAKEGDLKEISNYTGYDSLKYIGGLKFTADYRYLQFTYIGDITGLRLGLDREDSTKNQTLWMAENTQGTFVTPSGEKVQPLVADELTTVVLDLKRSGVQDVNEITAINWHYTGAKIKITDARMVAALDEEELKVAETPNIMTPASNKYTVGEPTYPLMATASVTDGGELSYQWYSNTVESYEDATKIDGATTDSYTPSSETTGVTYYFCEVTNTNDKATETKVTTAKSGIAKIEVTNAQVVDNSGNGAELKTEDPIQLDGDENHASSMIGDYTSEIVGTDGYKYLGFVTTKDAGSSYKYLKITYKGDISSLRLEFEDTVTKAKSKACWVNQEPVADEAKDKNMPCVSYDGKVFCLKSGDKEATIVIDLEKTGINMGLYNGIHMHYGSAVLAGQNVPLVIKDAQLLKLSGTQDVEVVKPILDAAKPSIKTNPVSASYTYNKTAKELTVVAASTDAGTLSYQWYSNTKDSIVGATPIANATKASYTPATNKVGTTYYFCKVTNTNDKATEIKTVTAYSKAAKIVVSKATNKITGVSSSYTKGIKSKAFTLKAKGQGKITYKSSNKKIVTVSSAGKVTIKGYGKATITITAAGNSNYTKVTKKVTVTVAPTTSLSKVQGQKRALKVTWKKDSKATGYQIQYSTDKNFKKSVKTVTIKKASTTSYTIKKLTGNKRYYVRMRAYKKVGKTTVYSSWTSAKNAKTKK